MTTHLQSWFQVSVIICLAILGFSRAMMLSSKGTRVVVSDSQMSRLQLLSGLVFVFFFFVWALESLSYGLNLGYHIPLSFLHIRLISFSAINLIGVPFQIAGLLLYALSLRSLGNSWRVGIDRENSGRLVTTGIFARSRNPIYISLELLCAGTFLLQGRLIFLITTIFALITLHIQILQEEEFLLQLHGEEFKRYCSKVARYF
jgi:protein-S-isoprenylcysteine O-methyltransferase Ste14